jgi:hypothetical protein
LLLAKPPPGFEKSIELDDPIELLEPLSFIIARLLNQLCANLQAHGLAVDELKLRLKLEDKTEHQRAIRLPFPMRESGVFLKLLLLDIESHPPPLAIIAVSIICEPGKPRSIQNGLFQPLAPEPEKLELTLARLTRLVGESNVGSPELVDTHRPGAFRVKRFIVKREFNRRGRRGHGGENGRKGEGEKGRKGEGEPSRPLTSSPTRPYSPSPFSLAPLLFLSVSESFALRCVSVEAQTSVDQLRNQKDQAEKGRTKDPAAGGRLPGAGPWRTSESG